MRFDVPCPSLQWSEENEKPESAKNKAKNVARMEKKLKKQQEKVREMFAHYEQLRDDTVSWLKVYHAKKMPALLAALQQLEMDRLAAVRKYLGIFSQLHKELVEPIPLSATFSHLVSSLSQEAELESCVSHWVSMYGEPPPPDPVTVGLPCASTDLDDDSWRGVTDEWESLRNQEASVDSVERPRPTAEEDRALRAHQRNSARAAASAGGDAAYTVQEDSVGKRAEICENTEYSEPTVCWVRASTDFHLDAELKFQAGDILRVVSKGTTTTTTTVTSTSATASDPSPAAGQEDEEKKDDTAAPSDNESPASAGAADADKAASTTTTATTITTSSSGVVHEIVGAGTNPLMPTLANAPAAMRELMSTDAWWTAEVWKGVSVLDAPDAAADDQKDDAKPSRVKAELDDIEVTEVQFPQSAVTVVTGGFCLLWGPKGTGEAGGDMVCSFWWCLLLQMMVL